MSVPQSKASTPPGKRPSLSADRFKALADGIFSVALTLLIMDVVASAKMPSPDKALSGSLTFLLQPAKEATKVKFGRDGS